ncbi:hypothetical protein, partial [Sphingomonas sp. 28-63-12]|uniref:hypothetical protein n=1 Tax=Sphingomonas sp. 28-63-12 TaxID=1970434 RepID=UPI0035A89389
ESFGFIMQPNSIESRTVYIAPFPPDFHGPLRLEGLLCAKLTGTDWRGNDTGATQEIALINIDTPAQSGKTEDIRVNQITNIVGSERAPNREMHLLGPFHYVPQTHSEQPKVPAHQNTPVPSIGSIEPTRNEEAPQAVPRSAR